MYKFILLFDLEIQMEMMAKRDILLNECMLHISSANFGKKVAKTRK